MKIKAQIAMVMNLDKCIGCHTCSIPCKHAWTSHAGAEYIWYNDVETKPGTGYPRAWENQGVWRGGWRLKGEKLSLASGDRLEKFLKIFYNDDLPQIDDYYEPWTYNYEHLTNSPAAKHQPVARSQSVLTKKNITPRHGPNWDDDLAGVEITGREDVNFAGLEFDTYMQFKKIFMFWLPRICEHCLNPSCVASCPSGALYKRDEDGIVLVDQHKCRGWRYCVSGCPYKKVYFNWRAGRAEKCLFCYPRVEAGLSTLCAESCVGRIRYIGVLLYDSDMLRHAASAPKDTHVYPQHLAIFLDPHNPDVVAQAAADGVHENFITAAKNSPLYKLIVDWKIALPLHPEFRTLPMVWYVPPLSPLIRESKAAEEIEKMRIPLQYLANLLAAGDVGPVRLALKRLAALRTYMRSVNVEQAPDEATLAEVGLTEAVAREMCDLLAIARYEERYVIPTAPAASPENARKEVEEVGYPVGGLSHG